MLLMQDPKLLLLDEPVAGMTDEETERRPSSSCRSKGIAPLVVVEHDMKFIGELVNGGQREKKKIVTVLHGQRCSPRARWPMCSRMSAWWRCTLAADQTRRHLGTEPQMLELKDVNQYYGGSHILRNVAREAKVGEITGRTGPQCVGKRRRCSKASWAWCRSRAAR